MSSSTSTAAEEERSRVNFPAVGTNVLSRPTLFTPGDATNAHTAEVQRIVGRRNFKFWCTMICSWVYWSLIICHRNERHIRLNLLIELT
mmetsp:Transcript_1532/g.2179  ORF Transcript_1532/g.2179 Transcript_1532/m.2179 type:complete len:89 (-) Transcript_1532:73-339(-)